MRNAVIGLILVMIMVFTGVAVNSAQSRTLRKNELDTRLGAAMEQSLRILMLNPVYTIHTDQGAEELTADFIENFLSGAESDSKYQIEIFGADVKKGLLDVKVTEHFRQVTGMGKLSARKTILLDRYENKENKYFTVTFYSEKLQKQVNVHGGDVLSEAMLPKSGLDKDGSTFAGWKLKKPDTGRIYSNAEITSMVVAEAMEFEAVYR